MLSNPFTTQIDFRDTGMRRGREQRKAQGAGIECPGIGALALGVAQGAAMPRLEVDGEST